MKKWLIFGLVILVIFVIWFWVYGPRKEVVVEQESKSIVPIVPGVTKEVKLRLELEKNRILINRDSPMHLEIELMDGGSKINFIFTPVMSSGIMTIKELHQQIAYGVAMIGYELIENPEWADCGGHVRYVFEDQGEIAIISLPVCKKFIKDFEDLEKAWNYLSDRIEWIKKEFKESN